MYVVVVWGDADEGRLLGPDIEETYEAAVARADNEKANGDDISTAVYKLVGPLKADTVVNFPAEEEEDE